MHVHAMCTKLNLDHRKRKEVTDHQLFEMLLSYISGWRRVAFVEEFYIITKVHVYCKAKGYIRKILTQVWMPIY